LPTDSPLFTIKQAARSCKVTFPGPQDVVLTGSSTNFKYECTGYAADVKAAVHLAEVVSTTSAATKISLLADAPTTGVKTIPYQVMTATQQGWQWQVTVKATVDDATQESSHFLISDGGEQCGAGATRKRQSAEATCSRPGAEYLAVSPAETYKLKTLKFKALPNECGVSGVTKIQITQDWMHNGTAKVITSNFGLYTASVSADADLVIGDNLVSFGSAAKTWKVYATDVQQKTDVIQFKVALEYSSFYAKLDLGTVAITPAAAATNCENVETTKVVTAPPSTTAGSFMTVSESVETVTQSSFEQTTPPPGTPASPGMTSAPGAPGSVSEPTSGAASLVGTLAALCCALLALF
jgi:hypothetical protein